MTSPNVFSRLFPLRHCASCCQGKHDTAFYTMHWTTLIAVMALRGAFLLTVCFFCWMIWAFCGSLQSTGSAESSFSVLHGIFLVMFWASSQHFVEAQVNFSTADAHWNESQDAFLDYKGKCNSLLKSLKTVVSIDETTRHSTLRDFRP